MSQKKIAIYYEHPEWFKPLFAELDHRGIAYDRLLAHQHHFDPAERQSPYSLFVNRMSPSAHTRGHTQAILYTLQYLAHLDEIGANVLNGYQAYIYEFSKARQLSLLADLGIRYPKARVINHLSQAYRAARGLTYPVVVKPNIGGSGAGILPFEEPDQLRQASERGEIQLGIDHTALVQEYLPARGDSIVRVEVLNGDFLYAIRLHLSPNSFNLCPADYCKVPETGLQDEVSGGHPVVESYTPSQEIIDKVIRITKAAQIEVGGVEYLINDRNGEAYFYDINALSNFVADAPNVIGFDPFPLLVDFVLERAGLKLRAIW